MRRQARFGLTFGCVSVIAAAGMAVQAGQESTTQTPAQQQPQQRGIAPGGCVVPPPRPPVVHGGPIENAEGALAPVVDVAPIPETDGPVVQLAILLDTSNSMDGLIHQAKTRLWQIVNEIGKGECEHVKPQLQVALYEYGNNGIEEADGYVRRRVPFTTDLDVVSEQLFSLRTNGGSEYCGWVIRSAVNELGWEEIGGGEPCCEIEAAQEPARVKKNVLRMIVIAGNEPFTQGSVDFRSSVPEAANNGIVVSTIFCGPSEHGRQTGWYEGARLGEGKYMSIDQNQEIVHVATPYDDRLLRLNTELNDTYLAYGGQGQAGRDRQIAQDEANQAAAPSALMSRVATKSTKFYSNSHWDLVDAVEEEEVDLAEIAEEDLPEEMREMTVEEREAHVAKLRMEREAVQQEIAEASAEREKFLAQHRAEQAGGATLDEAILGAIRELAVERGFVFPEQTPEASEEETE